MGDVVENRDLSLFNVIHSITAVAVGSNYFSSLNAQSNDHRQDIFV